MKRAALFCLLCSCTSADDPPPLAEPPPPEPPRIASGPCAANVTVSEARLSRSGIVLAHLVVTGLDASARVELPSPPYMRQAQAKAPAQRVPPAFETDTSDASPTPAPTARRSGIMDVFGHLLKGAVIGLTNLVLLPINLPLSIIDSRHEVFPLSWNAGELGGAYPTSAPGFALFDDSLLPPEEHKARKDAYDARVALQEAAQTAIEARARKVFSPKCERDTGGGCELDTLVDGAQKTLELTITGDACERRLLTVEVPAPPEETPIDEGRGSVASQRAWQAGFGTVSPQLVAAASAADAFKMAAPAPPPVLDNASIVCRVTTTRAAAAKKKAVIAARLSFGDLAASGAGVQARQAGEPFVFVVPHVHLSSGGRMKLAIVDAHTEWGAAAVTPFDGNTPLAFHHRRFDAECRAIGVAGVHELEARSLERLKALPDLLPEDFALDPKKADARAAARVKIVDLVRDIEALSGRHTPAAKEAQAFADARFKTWATALEAEIARMVGAATTKIAFAGGELEVKHVTKVLSGCRVEASYTAKKKGRLQFDDAIAKIRFVNALGITVEPYFVDPWDTKVSPAAPIDVRFDVPMVESKLPLCGVGLAPGGALRLTLD
ncbi:MAG: hypothetical protein IT381_15860 [Deltaproteobacteria bacterium]|nr:hypothetical protein [Deltaproteobacteria bacterium]